jgi:hypothetical protein
MTDRAFPRYAHEAAATLRHGDTNAAGRTKNVSKGGICVHADAAMPVGAAITVELALIFDEGNVSEPLELPARVAWSTPLDDGAQIGLSFRGLSADQTKYLDMFLRFLADQEPRRTQGESDHDDLFSRRRR